MGVGTEVSAPSGGIPLSRDSVLVVDVFSGSTSGFVLAQVLTVRRDGRWQKSALRVPLLGSGARERNKLNIGDGWLVGVSLDNTLTGNPVGIAYARIGVSTLSDADPHVNYLCQGYFGYGGGPSWSTGGAANNDVFEGLASSIDLGLTGAGADFQAVVGLGRRVLVDSVHCTLSTDATVANRTVQVELQDVGFWTKAASNNTITQAASLIRQYNFMRDFAGAAFQVGANIYAGIPQVMLSSVDNCRTRVVNLQAGDQITTFRVTGRVWIERGS